MAISKLFPDIVDARENYLKRLQAQFSSATSPYERMGLALGNIAGKAFGIEDPALKQASDIQSVYNEVAQRIPDQTSPEFYIELAKAIPPEYSSAKQMALEKAQEVKLAAEDRQMKRDTAKRAATEAERKDLEYFAKNPDQTGVELERLAKIIEADPTNEAALARYQKVATAGTTGAIEQTSKKEKFDLELKKEKVLIDKYQKELKDSSKLDPVAKYNSEIQSARDLMQVYGIDPTKPIKGQVPASVMATAGTVLLSAQQKALLKRTDEGGTPLASQPAAPVAAPAGAPMGAPTGKPKTLSWDQLPTRK